LTLEKYRLIFTTIVKRLTKKSMRITIKDVAKKANVSTATVSLVVNNNPRIPQDTKRRVQKIINELGYQPSRSARDLVSRKSGNIGFILTEDHFLKTEPFYTKIFLGTEFEARKHPYYVLLSMIPTDYTIQDHLPRFIPERSVDGIIIAGKVPDGLISILNKHPYPIVYVDYYPNQGDHPAVLIDNLNGGMIATQHLVDCGRRDIAFIGSDIQHPSIRDRFLGYKTILEKNKIKYADNRVIISDKIISQESGYICTKKLLANKNRVNAIFACNDAMAIGALKCLKDNNIKVPEDISIVGFDDIQMDLMVDPPITTIHVSKEDMGSEAMRLIIEILTKKVSKVRKILMPVTLVERQSTCKL